MRQFIFVTLLLSTSVYANLLNNKQEIDEYINQKGYLKESPYIFYTIFGDNSRNVLVSKNNDIFEIEVISSQSGKKTRKNFSSIKDISILNWAFDSIRYQPYDTVICKSYYETIVQCRMAYFNEQGELSYFYNNLSCEDLRSDKVKELFNFLNEYAFYDLTIKKCKIKKR